MQDLVAVAVVTDTGETCYFMTWGRVQSAVDPEPLVSTVMKFAHKFATPGKAPSARVCLSLREARDAPAFYEGIFSFSSDAVPVESPDYDEWLRRVKARMAQGKELYYLGHEAAG